MDAIWESINWQWSDHPKPDDAAIERSTELLKATKAAGLFPEEADSGRFPTVRLFWKDGDVEVEVFQNSFELYFPPSHEQQKSCPILEFDASSPDGLPALLASLAEILSKH